MIAQNRKVLHKVAGFQRKLGKSLGVIGKVGGSPYRKTGAYWPMEKVWDKKQGSNNRPTWMTQCPDEGQDMWGEEGNDDPAPSVKNQSQPKSGRRHVRVIVCHHQVRVLDLKLTTPYMNSQILSLWFCQTHACQLPKWIGMWNAVCVAENTFYFHSISISLQYLAVLVLASMLPLLSSFLIYPISPTCCLVGPTLSPCLAMTAHILICNIPSCQIPLKWQIITPQHG